MKVQLICYLCATVLKLGQNIRSCDYPTETVHLVVLFHHVSEQDVHSRATQTATKA